MLCVKMFKGFRGNINFSKYFCLFISKSFHIHFDPSLNISPILLLIGLVMVTNEESIARKYFKQKIVGGYLL